MTGFRKTNAKQKIDLGGLLLGIGIAYLTAKFLDSFLEPEEKDTVNYTLYRRRRVVYHGITYEDRLDHRLNEHERAGKKFTLCVHDDPRTRSNALDVEERRIRRDNPKYNVQHNCY